MEQDHKHEKERGLPFKNKKAIEKVFTCETEREWFLLTISI